jgi:hypothetical protein
MPPKGWKDIPMREEDWLVIAKFAEENDRSIGKTVKKAFRDAYGLNFPSKYA